MSLRVWLPLKNNLNNQGISNLKFSIYNTSIASLATGVGKTSPSSYYNNTWAGGGIISDTPIDLGTQQSMCCWINPSAMCPDAELTGIAGQHRYSTCSGMGLTLKYINSSTAYLSVNTGNGSERSYVVFYGNTQIKAGVWTHIAYTYDGTYIRLYVNGVLDAIHTYTGQKNVSDYIITHAWSLDGGFGTRAPYQHYNYYGYMNDFRAYDHCLSDKEVYEISKGLILHYPLNNPRNNYLLNTANPQSVTGLIDSSIGIKYDAELGMNVFERINTSTGENYIYTARTGAVNKSYNYIFSCDMWCNDYVVGTEFYWLSDTEDNQKSGSGYVNITNKAIAIPVRNQWFHVQVPFSTTSTDRTGYVRIDNNGSTSSGTPAVLRVANLKLEEGSEETPWVPRSNSSDPLYTPLQRGSMAVTDESGFGNNGTRVGSYTRRSDSPRYANCVTFNGTDKYIYCGREMFVRDELTASIWGYMSDWSGFTRLMSCTESGGWNFENNGNYMTFAVGTGASSCTYKIAQSTMTLANIAAGWHMFTGVYDGLTVKLYIDGVLNKTTAAYSSKTPIFYNSTNGLFIGAEAATSTTSPGGEYFNGGLSDARIYAKALSAEDIAELYNAAVQIDDKGNMYGYEYWETPSITTKSGSSQETGKISSRGIVESHSFSELGPTQEMAIKTLSDGSMWARIFWHDVGTYKHWFNSSDEAKHCVNQINRYSRMDLADQFKTSAGVYEFMLTYPSQSSTAYNRWTQTSSPSAGTVTGYTAKSISWSAHSAGIRTAVGSSQWNCDSGGTWYAALGQFGTWTDTQPIPAADGSAQTSTELWVRIDNIPKPTQLQIFEKTILSPNFIEL